MKENNKKREKWLHVRLTKQEFEQFHKDLSKTTDTKASAYARKMLLQKPVVISYRNDGLKDVLNELTTLKKELNSIAVNFNQAVKKLNMFSEQEVRAHLPKLEIDQKALVTVLGKIDHYLSKTAQLWLRS